MRYAIIAAGLVAAAQATVYTVTATDEVTITSCAPTHTGNCPYKPKPTGGDYDHGYGDHGHGDDSDAETSAWANWDPSKGKETTTSSWGTWDPSKGDKASSSWTAWDPKNTGTWSAWDPSKGDKASSTWASWDPKDTASWSAWDPSKGDKASSTWASWDPKDTASWSAWDPSKGSKASTSWSAWDPKDTAKDATTWSAWDPAKDTATWSAWDPAKTPAASSTWGTWDPKTPDAASSTWGTWDGASSKTPAASSAACPMYTETAPPAWFSQLPTKVLASLAAEWTGTPPSDWCYYSYSLSTVATSTKTPDAASATWSAWTGTGTPVDPASKTSPAGVAKYTGAANANAASIVLGGAAAIAALVLA